MMKMGTGFLVVAVVSSLAVPAEARRWEIEAGSDAGTAAVLAFNSALDGDVIEFGPGVFHIGQTLSMSFARDITIEGAGRDRTVLSFATSTTPEGINLSHMDGVTIRNLTVLDTPGFSIKVSDSDFVRMKGIRAMWSSADGRTDPANPATLNVGCTPNLATIGHPRTDRLLDASLARVLDLVTGLVPLDGIFPSGSDLLGPARGPGRVVAPDYVPSSANGGYAIYPVLSNDVVLDDVEAVGASDAGIYVGQSNRVIVKNSRAVYNVAGFEIENTDDTDMFANVAECNTSGFLIFDLPGLNQYGDRTRMFQNVARYNNTVNFAPGGIVGAVPAGTGTLILGYDHIEIFDNLIEHHRTAGLVIASHELLDGSPQNVGDRRMDLYTDSLHVHDNVFTNSGYAPQEPEVGVVQFDPETGLPSGFDDGHDSLLPALIMIKSIASAGPDHAPLPRGAHVVWDGMFDRAPYTFGDTWKDPASVPGGFALGDDCTLDNYLSPPDPDILDALGKPQYTGVHYPRCRYNAYKFDGAGNRRPLWSHCYERNVFSPESETYMNFRDTDPTSPASFDIDEHSECEIDGEPREPLPAAVVGTFEGSGGGGSGPTDEEIAENCGRDAGADVNWAAVPYDCPKLSDWNLFADPADPRSGPNGSKSALFDLNTPLFSDYARKYRFVFVPDAETVGWRFGDASMPNETLHFPAGTILAKTFSFPHDTLGEDVVETRLLVHRPDADGGDGVWRGLVYLWEKDANGDLVEANLVLGGATADVAWDYADPDPEVGKRYTGSTDRYSVPTVDQCKQCHANDDRPAGAAPIGPKVRNLNRPTEAGGSTNQLQQWVDLGILEEPSPSLAVSAGVATNVPRLPRFDVGTDEGHGLPPAFTAHADGSGHPAIQARARAWLETNCAHCHNPKGGARNSGFFLDVFREVDFSHGICKVPTAAGRGSGGRPYDIVPGKPADSILPFRIESVNASEQMPPIARSVQHAESLDLIQAWIAQVVDGAYPAAGCEQ